jgi:hypothetical protein
MGKAEGGKGGKGREINGNDISFRGSKWVRNEVDNK